ncbi:NAD(P)/FAD-dependent oxidoreductase [Amphibacillus sediminis]|uniref:NAD(P)/FAD-dependent oxidoreductase n=1 Tax=Amphibacillus sediminis TaxID=360185 RepID=UPI00082FCFFA|nr:NAD(P)/FAD-dependent oxidoreductase [Amphibacillus sediminis]
MNKEVFEVTIIGGGPAGLFSAFYSGLREMRTKIIEYQPVLGGKIHFYPEKMIWDVGGLTPVLGEQLINQLVQQGLTFDPEVVLNEKISSISREQDGTFILRTSSGNVHYSKTVIVAVGGGILKPQKIEINGAERFELTNLNYTIKSLEKFKGKTVLISGGGNSAVDWANELEPIAKQVHLIYRKEALNSHEAQTTQVLQSSTICHFNTTITKLLANEAQDVITQVELTNHANGDIHYLNVDEVMISHGFERETELLDNSEINVELIDHYFISGNALSQTSVPGLFAAGDILKYEGKLNLIAGAFQDAANAVNQAKLYLSPEAAAGGMVSSHNDLFQSRNRQLIKQLLK